MPTPSGAISLDDVNEELRISTGTSISMSDADVRALARDTSGAISMNSLRGKSIVELPASLSGTSNRFGSTSTVTAQVSFSANTTGGISVASFTDTGTQYSNTTWHILEPLNVGSDYIVRFTGTLSGDATLGTGAALNTWYSLNPGESLVIRCSASPFDTFDEGEFSGTVQINDITNGGNTEVDSATLFASVVAQYGSPE